MQKICQCTSHKINNKLLNNVFSTDIVHKTSINNNDCKSTNKIIVKKFDPWQRLYDRSTDSFKMKTVSRKIHRYQGDELDFLLSSIYQHNLESFGAKYDIYYQAATLESTLESGKKKKPGQPQTPSQKHPWDKIPGSDADSVNNFDTAENMHKQLFEDHPLIIGGIIERIHPSSIKLMNSSHHSPQTNAGYVRQDRDGTLFQY